jgi:hypothetical protein
MLHTLFHVSMNFAHISMQIFFQQLFRQLDLFPLKMYPNVISSYMCKSSRLSIIVINLAEIYIYISLLPTFISCFFFFGVFKMKNYTYSSFIMSIHLSVWNNSRTTEWVSLNLILESFTKCIILFYKKLYSFVDN